MIKPPAVTLLRAMPIAWADLSFALFLGLVAPMAQADPPATDTAKRPPTPASIDAVVGQIDRQSLGRIDGMKRLPIKGLQMVQSGDKIFLLSSEGRFVITGKLYDMFSRSYVNTLDDADRAANTLDLKKTKVNVGELGPVVYGNGSADVVVFMDPRCDDCRKLLRDAQALEKRYTFKVVMVPVIGPESAEAIRAIGCTYQIEPDKARGVLRAEDYNPIAVPKDCNSEPMLRGLVAAQLLGINGPLTVIRPDGRVNRGDLPNLAAFLEGKENPS